MDKTEKACWFATLIVCAYGIHQFTVGGDGVVFGAVCAAIGAIGGYAWRVQA